MTEYKQRRKSIPSEAFNDKQSMKRFIEQHFNVPTGMSSFMADYVMAITSGRRVMIASGRGSGRSLLSKFERGFEIIPKEKTVKWKFNIGETISGPNKSGRHMKGVIYALVTSIRASGETQSYQIRESVLGSVTGKYFYVPKDIVECSWAHSAPAASKRDLAAMNLTADIIPNSCDPVPLDDDGKEMRIPMTGWQNDGCAHDLRIYDSGWTKEEYCTKCTHKRKL